MRSSDIRTSAKSNYGGELVGYKGTVQLTLKPDENDPIVEKVEFVRQVDIPVINDEMSIDQLPQPSEEITGRIDAALSMGKYLYNLYYSVVLVVALVISAIVFLLPSASSQSRECEESQLRSA